MKLKTLKDIDIAELPCCRNDRQDKFVGDLRQEAIKWIKEFKEGKCWTDFAADELKGQENVRDWIKHFFNIKESDLK